MTRLFLLVALAAASMGAPALAADATAISLLGRDPGQAPAYSCFSRHYDAAHLASHPRQNVTDISVFVNSSIDPDSKERAYSLEMGVGFRKIARQFEVSGSCSRVDGKQGLTCGVDCDGGHFDVTTSAGQSLLVAVPDSVAVWDPAASDDAEPHDLPKGAEFGSDDKLFRLDRADLAACRALMDDDTRAALYGTRSAAK